MEKIKIPVQMANGQTAYRWGYPEVEKKERAEVIAGIFGPYMAECGWFIMRFARYVHSYPCKTKIVVCERGEQGLFPTATHFYTDWKNEMPDHLRGDSNDQLARRLAAPILARVQKLYPDAMIVPTPVEGTLLPVKFEPRLDGVPVLEHCDIVICARRRSHVPQRNWGSENWNWLVNNLITRGVTVGIIGLEDSSETINVNGVVRGWQHPDGPMAGALELLSRCTLYVGTDTGISHLAALLNTDMVLFHHPEISGQHKMVKEIKAGTFGQVEDLGVEGWLKPQLLLKTIMRREYAGQSAEE